MTQIDLQPTLVGGSISLRPIEAMDFDPLYCAASDPVIWKMHPDSQRYKRDVFQSRFFEGALASGGALVVEEKVSGRIVGSSRYYEWDEKTQEIGIGYTFIERKHWGVGTNSEMKALMLNHIFQWARVVWFHVGKDNVRSRRAVEKLGATLSHEEDRVLDDQAFTQLYYKLEVSSYGG